MNLNSITSLLPKGTLIVALKIPLLVLLFLLIIFIFLVVNRVIAFNRIVQIQSSNASFALRIFTLAYLFTAISLFLLALVIV